MMKHKLAAWTALLLCLALAAACAAAETPAPTVIRFTAVPDEAFGEEGRMVIAGTADGARLLIAGAYELYIWNTETGERIPLTFSREEDREYLDMKIRTALGFTSAAQHMKKDQREAYIAKMEQAADEYLAARGLDRFSSLDQIAECFDHLLPLGARCKGLGDSFALTECSQIGLEIATDLRTGESRLIGTDPENSSRIPSAVCGDRLFSKDGLFDMNTWESDYPEENHYYPSFAGWEGALPEEGLSIITAMALRPDDSLVYISRGSFDRESGTTSCYLALRSAEKSAVLALGQFSGMYTPEALLFAGNGRYVLAYSPSLYTVPPVILDMETGEKQTLEPGEIFFFAACDAGFVAYDYRNRDNPGVVLLDPETLETKPLRLAGDDLRAGDMTIISSVADNGRGMLFSSSSGTLRGYFTLETE